MSQPDVFDGICSQCGTQNDGQRKFCLQCAGPLRYSCLVCSYQNSTSQKACQRCRTDQALEREIREQCTIYQPEFVRACEALQEGDFKRASAIFGAIPHNLHSRLVTIDGRDVYELLSECLSQLAVLKSLKQLVRQQLEAKAWCDLEASIEALLKLQPNNAEFLKLRSQIETRRQRLMSIPPNVANETKFAAEVTPEIAAGPASLANRVGLAVPTMPAKQIHFKPFRWVLFGSIVTSLGLVFSGWWFEWGQSSERSERPSLAVTKKQSVAHALVPGIAERMAAALKSSPTAVPDIENSIGMEFIWCPPGEFLMGSPETESGRRDDEQQHLVQLTSGFYLSRYLVTVEQASLAIRKPIHAQYLEQAYHFSTWNDATIFCRQLTNLPEERSAGRVYRLPTEAEWEYACRAGTTTPFYFGEDVELWVAYSSSGGPVGQKISNPWGFFDMAGGTTEWCQDWYAPFNSNRQIDPQGPDQGAQKVFRGQFRSARRVVSSGVQLKSGSSTGLRLVVEIRNPQESSE